jgi:hypothetical protein
MKVEVASTICDWHGLRSAMRTVSHDHNTLLTLNSTIAAQHDANAFDRISLTFSSMPVIQIERLVPPNRYNMAAHPTPPPYTRFPTTEPSRDDGARLVIGLDFGTTFSGEPIRL